MLQKKKKKKEKKKAQVYPTLTSTHAVTSLQRQTTYILTTTPRRQAVFPANTTTTFTCYRDTDGKIWTPPLSRRCERDACVLEENEPDGVRNVPWSNCKAISGGHVFLMNDAMALGHFQMTLTQLFSYLVKLDPGAIVEGAFEQNRCPCPKSSLYTHYYAPLLEMLQRFVLSQYNVTFRINNSNQNNYPWCHRNFARRSCLRGHLIQGGHCGGWFAEPRDVAAFRRFLTVYDLIDSPLADSTRLLNVSVFGRVGGGRSFADPKHALALAERGCREALKVPCDVRFEMHPADAKSFAWNCRKYSRPDLILEIHGASLSNLVCARAGAGLIEILAPGHWATMYTYLATQMGMHYCGANAVQNCCRVLDNASVLNCFHCLSGKLRQQAT